MRTSRRILQRGLFFVLLGLSFALFTNPVFAQSTSSQIRVVVVDSSGNAVDGVGVRVTHIPTGRTQVLISTPAGLATARGMQVGGPYRVESADYERYISEAIEEVFLTLGETEVVDLVVTAGSTTLEEVIVSAQQLAERMKFGSGADYRRETIEAIPSLSRDFVSTLATDPKILVDNSVARGPAVSIAGGNYRYNSVTIDGVTQNDNFGLSKNASAGQRTPISIDAIEALEVNITPFDVTYGNFVGGNINVVTKSGTNEFHGSIYGYKTDDSFTGNSSDGVDLKIADFKEEYYGATFGGPIVKDKLFFFAAYEKFDTTRPSNTQSIDRIAGVTQADVDEAIDIFNTVYGFDPGKFADTDDDEDEKILFKLDWFINDDHRFAASYQKAEGDVLFDDFPELAILNSNRYNINEKLEAYSFQLFSNWNDSLSTELKIGFKDHINRQVSAGDTNTPDFGIFTDGGGFIGAGNDRFRHTNELDNETDSIKLRIDYQAGDHTLTGGWEQEKHTVRNLFLPGSKGWVEFFGLDALRNRDIAFVLYGNANSGVGKDAEANFSLTVDSFYLQDEWTLADNLSVKFGLRYDTYSNSDPVTENPYFTERNGFPNTENLDGKDLFSPRFGFNWAASDRLTVRGGAGLFGGGTPLIMLSNSYAGNSITRTFLAFFAPFFGPPISDNIAAFAAALPDPNSAFENFQQYIGPSALFDVDALHPDFDILSSWKFSLGFDYYADLGFLGDDWLISAEVIHTDVKNGYNVIDTKRVQIGTAPDGRPIYSIPNDSNPNDFENRGDYVVTNTSRGGGQVYTLNIAKSWDTDHGFFDGTLGVTLQDLEELRSYNRFVGFESFAMDPQLDMNNPSLADSRYETPRRITGTLNWSKELFGDNRTMVSLIYTGRSGLHFSHVFGSANIPTFGGAFLADWGSEADNPGSQLFYVPTGVDDPLVTGDPEFLANMNAYIDGEPCLSGSRGKAVERNACKSAWSNIFSVRFMQEIGIWDGKKLELTLDIENVGNLISSDWGRLENYTAPSNVAVANVAITADGSQYILSATTTDVVSPDTVVRLPAIAALPSVYRVQFGIRFRF